MASTCVNLHEPEQIVPYCSGSMNFPHYFGQRLITFRSKTHISVSGDRSEMSQTKGKHKLTKKSLSTSLINYRHGSFAMKQT